MDRADRLLLIDRFRALGLPVTTLARAADVDRARTRGFLAGGVMRLYPDETQRIVEAINRLEAIFRPQVLA